ARLYGRGGIGCNERQAALRHGVGEFRRKDGVVKSGAAAAPEAIFLISKEDIEGGEAAVGAGDVDLQLVLFLGGEGGVIVELLLKHAQFLAYRGDFLEEGLHRNLDGLEVGVG